MTTNQLPSGEYLRKCFTYDPCDGLLCWNYRDDVPTATNTRFAGKVVGTPNNSGLSVRLNNISYAVHRIIYVMMTDEILTIDDEIDHIDRCHFNNEWSNIRKVTHQQNMFNRVAQSNNLVGIKCIGLLDSGKFRVRVSASHIGCYNTIEEATIAAEHAIQELHGKYGRLT